MSEPRGSDIHGHCQILPRETLSPRRASTQSVPADRDDKTPESGGGMPVGVSPLSAEQAEWKEGAPRTPSRKTEASSGRRTTLAPRCQAPGRLCQNSAEADIAVRSAAKRVFSS